MKQNTLNRACRQSIFAKLGRLSYRYRALVIAIWGVLVLLSLMSAPRLDSVLKGVGTVYEAGEATRVERLLKQELNVDPDALTIVFESSTGQTLDAHQPEYRSTDGRTEYSIINLKVGGSEVVPVIDSIEQTIAQNKALSVKTYLTGKPVVDHEAQRISKADLSRAEAIALPLTLIAL